MSVVAFLPAKGTSERVLNKNTRMFCGEPLFLRTLRKLLRCPSVDAVYLDSDDPTILALGEQAGAIPLPRNPSLATNQTDGHQLFANEVAQVDASIYLQVLCTSPFVTIETIERAIHILKTDQSYDSVVLGHEQVVYPWSNGLPDYPYGAIPNSSDLQPQSCEGMSLYAVRGEEARTRGRRIGERPYFLVGTPMECLDINTEGDWELTECVARGMRQKEQQRFNFLKSVLSSAIISDACDDLGIGGSVGLSFRQNIPGRVLFGRASTIEIGPCEPDEAHGIYDGLRTYESMAPETIVVVKNRVEGLAYFGELNARLALRAGVQGVVIDGTTRDWTATTHTGLPVFARSIASHDVRGKATVRYINEPITFGSTVIRQNDMIFADTDGVVVLPDTHKDRILERALAIAAREHSIVQAIQSGAMGTDLLDTHGCL